MGELIIRNNDLLKDWEILCKTKEKESFVKDGLLFRGDITLNKNKCWNRIESGHEDTSWEDIPLKIMFLMKDFTNNDMPDIRTETMRKNGISKDTENPIKRDSFSMNILYWLYGMTHNNVGRVIPFSEIMDGYKCFQFYEKYPLVRINCKKNHGGYSISNGELKSYLSDPDYSVLLAKQIKLFNADIILCCGGSGLIKSFVEEKCYDDLIRINNWMFYSSKFEKLVINSYHPSCRKSRRWLYEELMKNYILFIRNSSVFSKKINLFMEYENNHFADFTYSIKDIE